jgi:hypothetical protein
MPTHRTFKGFFSYAGHDAKTDPTLIPAFTTDLENRVNAKLVNARFSIWRDEESLQTGEIWNRKIETELKEADILIVLLTPRWIDSEYCRKEYTIFEEVELARAAGEYIIPLLVRSIERQEKHFTDEQKDVYERVLTRQYQVADAIEVVKLTQAGLIGLIDKIADDIVGMLERIRGLPAVSTPDRPMVRRRWSKEFDAKAQNYERVDFVTNAEVILDRPTGGRRDVLAHVGFMERLYVQGTKGRIEFGVRRAFLSITDGGIGRIVKLDELKRGDDSGTRYYTTLQDDPEAVTICMDPPAGKSSLAELPLPPARGENLLSKVAAVTAETKAGEINAELIVSLDAEGLYLPDGKVISPRTAAAIKAIMNIANTKQTQSGNQTVDGNGLFHRTIQVKERS